jgi:hypothetical protein
MTRDGYFIVVLSKNEKTKTKRISRLVAETFIDNPNNFTTVDHIDRNRTNNIYTNLRWANYSMQNKNKTKIQELSRNLKEYSKKRKEKF